MLILDELTGKPMEFKQGATSCSLNIGPKWPPFTVYVDVCPGCGEKQKGEEICERCSDVPPSDVEEFLDRLEKGSCPHNDPFHDHGDGCPSCDINICTTCHTVHSESECPRCEEEKIPYNHECSLSKEKKS